VSRRMLELHEYDVRDIDLGDRTEFVDGVLLLDRDELAAVAAPASPLEALDIDVARPGDALRLNRVLDVLEPRAKISGHGVTFPGILTPVLECGIGVTAAAAGMAVVATGTFASLGGAFEQHDCVIDMAGPGALHTPFSSTVNLVLAYRLEPGADQAEAERAQREANIRIARWIGSVVAESGMPHRSRTIPPASEGRAGVRPRLAYVCQLISEGCLHDTLLRGKTTEHLEPVWITPAEMHDGALVSADFHYACQRVPTYLYQRNPLVEALQARSEELDFAGVILTIRRETDTDKRRAAAQIVSLARGREVSGLITHPAVGGNAQLDGFFVVQEAEQAGIRTAMIVQEMAGVTGADPGLVDFVEEADLLVSTGNREELLSTAVLDVVLGDDRLLDGSSAVGALRVPLRFFLGSTTQVGALKHRGTAA
jgi:glycine reductase complex component B subunit alpha and beta